MKRVPLCMEIKKHELQRTRRNAGAKRTADAADAAARAATEAAT